MAINKICVMGLGYIGLPTATVFALAGKQVVGVDINHQVVETLRRGAIHLVEPELAEPVKQAVESGRFFATLQPEPADAFVIAVPTPLVADNRPALDFIWSAVEMMSPVLSDGNLIVLESTSPVGTTEQLAERIKTLRPELSLHFAYCPERVLPGKMMQEIYTNDRIIGGLTEAATEQAVDLYQIFAKGACIPTSARTAELCKLAENSFRDVNIAFANELSMVCDHLQIDVWELIKLANRHPRVHILQPGAGVGGHCIAVDPWFIVADAPEQAKLIRTAREVNDAKPHWVLEKIKTALADCANAIDRKPSEITIACLGLSFKADIDDLRESPALEIATALSEWHTGSLWVVEPHITQLPLVLQKKADFVPLECAIEQADILVLLVDHQQFKEISIQDIPQRWVVDTRGVWGSR